MATYPRLKAVTPLDDYLLQLTFEEGEMRIYNFKPNLNHKFYKPLVDLRLFKAVSVSDGEIEWISGQDFCPNTLYEESYPVS